jgi:hypothetical protein
MLKFVVVLYRRPDLSPEAFFANCGANMVRWPNVCPGCAVTFKTMSCPIPSASTLDGTLSLSSTGMIGLPWKQRGLPPKAKPRRIISKRSRTSPALPGPLCRSTSADELGGVPEAWCREEGAPVGLPGPYNQ